MQPLYDKFGRAITDLRISITDRCNYKCVYCRTGNEGALYGDLPFADYLRMARVLVGMGITKVRLTGGEPLLRNGVVDFVRELRQLRRPQKCIDPSPPKSAAQDDKARGTAAQDDKVRGAAAQDDKVRGTAAQDDKARGTAAQDDKTSERSPANDDNGFEPIDIALTTNGHLLADLAQPLKDAGLTRVTVSMDAVDPDRFARITRVPNGYDQVLAGIRAARRAGLWPLKVNCVLMRGFNEDQIIPFGMFAREEGVTVRFIEFMPLEEDRTWAPSTVVPLEEIVARMSEYRPLVEIPRGRSETARRYRFDDGVGEIGIIAPVSHPFCGHCSRIRITSDGKIRTCLFSVWDHDLHAQMQRGASDEELAEYIQGVVMKKEERHHIGEPDFVPASRTMVHIGG
ncbi:MAG: GTP 3',8-cyclase MoaA [Candidatus Sulfotelmatobacter sp.]